MTEQSSRSRAFWAGWTAAGVLLLIAAVAGVYAANLKIQLDDVELRLVDAVTKLELSEGRLVGAATESSAIRANLALLSAPETVILKLAGRGSMPDATGRVFFSKTKGLLFSASKLTPLGDGQEYQLWLLPRVPAAGAAARAISVGTVRTGENGNVTAAFDPPGEAPAQTGFNVTVEPEGGSSSPTGAVCLTTE